MPRFVFFHKPDEENGYMSNWYMRSFTIDGKTDCCAEQFMMEQKALLFADADSAAKIMQTRNPQEMQDLGRGVSGFVPAVWNGHKQLIIYRALIAKFEQNPDLREALFSTGTATPVECSRSDKIWGIGRGMHDTEAANPDLWNGQNLLGFTLQAVRAELLRRSALEQR